MFVCVWEWVCGCVCMLIRGVTRDCTSVWIRVDCWSLQCMLSLQYPLGGEFRDTNQPVLFVSISSSKHPSRYLRKVTSNLLVWGVTSKGNTRMNRPEAVQWPFFSLFGSLCILPKLLWELFFEVLNISLNRFNLTTHLVLFRTAYRTTVLPFCGAWGREAVLNLTGLA